MEEKKEYVNVPIAGYTKASLLKKAGEVLEGTYEGYHQGGKFNSISHFLILDKGGVKVQLKNEDGDYDQFAAKSGDKIAISGTKKLNEGLSGVKRGSKIAIKFAGFKEFKTLKGESAREALLTVNVISQPEGDLAVETDNNQTIPNVFAQS